MSGNAPVADHLSADEVRKKMQMMAGFLKLQKWLVIYNAIIDPRPVAEIAKHTGLSEATVLRIISEYNSGGPESVERNNRPGMDAWFKYQAETMSV